MKQEHSARVASALLDACTGQAVRDILDAKENKSLFADDANWLPYGRRQKNWDTIANQQSNAVAALTEILVNAEDSVLIRKALEAGVEDLRGPEAPASMFDAVRRFFPQVPEGRISSLGAEQRTALANECILVGVRRGVRSNSQFPTYTIVDRGEGQEPDDFPNTFLSLGERNKEGIAFVQGKFNMGSTGSLRFCTMGDITQGHHKFILSKRYNGDVWGWTVLRVRPPRGAEALPVAEYFAPGGKIPRHKTDSVSAFGQTDIGVITSGSVVKLYDYDIGEGNSGVDFGLYYALTRNLIECALPIRLFDFNAQPVESRGGMRARGIAERTFGGLSTVLHSELREGADEDADIPEKPDPDHATEFVHLVRQEIDEELGTVKVVAVGLHNMQEWLGRQRARVFYTLNGQTHAVERGSFFNTQRVGLGDLSNHLVVNVVCDEMDKTALTTIFMPDRERKVDNRLSRKLEDILAKALHEDSKLRQYVQVIRRRRAAAHVDNPEETKDLFSELLKIDPAIKELFGLGTFVIDLGKKPSGAKPFDGKPFPTFLKPLNLRQEEGKFVKEVPLNANRRIECGTDAANDYLTRTRSPGWAWCSRPAHEAPHSVGLYNGTASFTVKAPASAKVGDEVEVEFGFQDYGRNHASPLKFAVTLRFVAEEEKVKSKSGKKTDTKDDDLPKKGLPSFHWVTRDQWGSHMFSEESGAYVSSSDDNLSVYINKDNRYLQAMRLTEKDEATRMLNEERFRWGLGLLTLAIHRRAAKNGDGDKQAIGDPDEMVRLASSAMSPYVVTVIRRFGGEELSG